MHEERPRPTTTIVAAALMMLVCIPFVINGFDLVELASNPSAADEELQHALIVTGLSDGGPRQVRTYAIIGAGMMLGLSVLALTLAAGVFRRREGAHHATIVVFAMLGLIALAASSQGLFADPPAEGAKLGLAVGLTNIGIVALLLTNSSREDVEHMESIRARRKYERQDARAARKAARRP
ncbi:MAG TPA: hypothetical protein VJ927_02300 [Actinomycetota bacterium]|nr:hypothetical protein [Actinomycetota bacterium]